MGAIVSSSGARAISRHPWTGTAGVSGFPSDTDGDFERDLETVRANLHFYEIKARDRQFEPCD
jgi:hypothetical protein